MALMRGKLSQLSKTLGERQQMQPDTLKAFSALPPHRVLDTAFGADLSSRLLSFAIEREGSFSDSAIGQGESEKVASNVRNSLVLKNFGEFRKELEDRFRGLLPLALASLGIEPFPLTAIAMELAAHGDGGFYRRHIDTFTGGNSHGSVRMLTAVYYFNLHPQAFTGGELRLHSLLPLDQGGEFIDVAPANDRIVLFPAWVPHEVLPTLCPGASFAQSRFAINCWYLGKPA